MNLPNKLTLLRVIMIPFFILFMLTDLAGETSKWIALAIFCVASMTDWLDGFLARKLQLVTNFGKFMDPLADKLLVCSAFICLTGIGRLASWVTILIVAREFIISGFRLIACEQGVVIAASMWGKVKTVSHMALIIIMLMNLEVLQMAEMVLVAVAVILTVVSLVDYMAKNWQVLAKGGF